MLASLYASLRMRPHRSAPAVAPPAIKPAAARTGSIAALARGWTITSLASFVNELPASPMRGGCAGRFFRTDSMPDQTDDSTHDTPQRVGRQRSSALGLAEERVDIGIQRVEQGVRQRRAEDMG